MEAAGGEVDTLRRHGVGIAPGAAAKDKRGAGWTAQPRGVECGLIGLLALDHQFTVWVANY